MSPVLSVVVPAYNAADYLTRALDTVIGFGPRIEILVIDDGSTDATAEIAQRYVDAGLVRLIRQQNAGHGGAVNTGIAHATGQYLKVLDADDWFDREALATVLDRLSDGPQVDLLVSNFVYEKVGKRHKTVVHYRGAMPIGEVYGWQRTRRFAKRQYLMMHALTYRTEVLRASGLRLPEHTFYVDNLFTFEPLPQVHTLTYLDVDLYRYFIGRADQSVQEAVMLRRLDQQLRVNRRMLDHLSSTPVASRRLRAHRLHHATLVCAVSSILLIRAGDLAERDRLWAELRAQDRWLYRRVRWSVFGQLSNLPGRTGRRVSVLAYRVAQRAIGFS